MIFFIIQLKRINRFLCFVYVLRNQFQVSNSWFYNHQLNRTKIRCSQKVTRVKIFSAKILYFVIKLSVIKPCEKNCYFASAKYQVTYFSWCVLSIIIFEFEKVKLFSEKRESLFCPTTWNLISEQSSSFFSEQSKGLYMKRKYELIQM